MCGIAGLVGRPTEANRRALHRMTDAMTHRGPDGEGHWESAPDEAGRAVLLGHRRLSILDLSTAASQPMTDPERGDVAVLNGEIYNYVALRTALEAHGHRLTSTGDTAAMLRHLSVHGFGAVRDLRGMFAIAVWDPRRSELLLARDALGIKPLYVARNPDPHGDWSVAFASEVRALLRSGLLPAPRLRAAAVATVIWNGFTMAPDTIVEGIDSLWPGEMRVMGRDGVERRRERYWTQSTLPSGPATTEEEVAAALETSVRLHLASDVPLGVFLSGGIDSSAIANVAKRVSKTPVHSFTLAFTEQARNEGEIARAVANAIGTEHHEIVLRQEDFLEHLDEAMASLDQPSFDGLNSFFMSRAVRDAGFKVALVGSGGDELFGGYTSFRDLPEMARWSRRAAWVPQVVRGLGARTIAGIKSPNRGDYPPQTRWAKLPVMNEAGDDLLALYQCAYGLFLPRTAAELMGEATRRAARPWGVGAAMEEALRSEIAGRSDLASIGALEQRVFLGERLLRDTDATSMASSIEIRLPLVDQDLLATVARLGDVERFEPLRSKAVLRRVGLRGLDATLFERPKSGFELPYDHWLRSALSERVDAVLGDADRVAAAGLSPAGVSRLWKAYRSGAAGLYWTRIWAVYSLVEWTSRHGLTIQGESCSSHISRASTRS